MHEIAGLIREFPEGSFFLLLALIWAVERMVVTGFNRNRPVVQCDREHLDDDDEEEE